MQSDAKALTELQNLYSPVRIRPAPLAQSPAPVGLHAFGSETREASVAVACDEFCDGPTLDHVVWEGKVTRWQQTQTLPRPDSLTFRWERSVEGAPWEPMDQGTCTKSR